MRKYLLLSLLFVLGCNQNEEIQKEKTQCEINTELSQMETLCKELVNLLESNITSLVGHENGEPYCFIVVNRKNGAIPVFFFSKEEIINIRKFSLIKEEINKIEFEKNKGK